MTQSLTHLNKLSSSSMNSSKVLFGLTFTPASFVALYLLKMQKFDLRVFVHNHHLLGAEKNEAPVIKCHYKQDEINVMREFCESLNIPIVIEDKVDEFEESIMGCWVADLLTQRKSRHCMRCFEFRMSSLYQKMIELSCDFISTGHYAKILTSEIEEGLTLSFALTANDSIRDQSRKISRLDQKILSSLILPLGDLTQKDISSLARNFGIHLFFENTLSLRSCFMLSIDQVDYLQKKLPPSMKAKEGLVFSDQIEKQNYFTNLQEKLNRNHHERVNLWMTLTEIPEKYICLPFKGFALIKTSEQQIPCRVFPKSLGQFLVEFDSPVKVFSGDSIAIIKKGGRHSKVLLSGEVRLFDLNDLRKNEFGKKSTEDEEDLDHDVVKSNGDELKKDEVDYFLLP